MSLHPFGRIIKSLRHEQIDFEKGGKWSQQKLAQAANLSISVIGSIERGERATLNEYEVTQLADALQLSTLERLEFFALAAGIKHENFYSRQK